MPSTDPGTIAHLLRRTGFAPTPAEVAAGVAAGYAATVDRLLDFSGPDAADAADAPSLPAMSTPTPGAGGAAAARAAAAGLAAEVRALQLWWLHRMAVTSHPLREKLTLYFHGHFATSADKVRYASLMYRQNEIFRTLGNGDFGALTLAVAKDPAMMIWLDAGTDKAARPNENFARELMELFTLGIGNYTEDDVREAARAFTGWVINPRTLSWALQAKQHDDGQKTFLGHTGDWGGEDVIGFVVNDAAGEAFVVARVWSHFAYPVTPADPIVTSLTPGYAADHNIGNLLRAVLLHPMFVSPTARSGLVKQPIEWVVGSLRVLGLPATDPRLVGALTQLGQVPFRPPNVGGWPQNGYWLSTATSLARLNIATVMAGAYHGAASPAALASLLSVDWSPTTAAALASASDPTSMLALALCSPEWVLA